MRRQWWLSAVLAVAVCLGAALAAGASVEPLRAMERIFNKRIDRFSIEDPILLMSSVQGVYVPGWGALFVGEVNLVPVAITPFRPSLSAEEKDRLHEKKRGRLDDIEKLMREMLLDAGASVDTVPASERIGVAMNLFHFQWEKTEGIPGQILMHARRSDLVAVKAGRTSAEKAIVIETK